MRLNETEVERLLCHVALPPLKFGLRVKRLEARSTDPQAKSFAEAELRLASTIGTRLARAGSWN